VLGVYVVLRRIVFVGAALAQISSAGIALALWLAGRGVGGQLTHHPVAFTLPIVLVGALFFSVGHAPRAGVPPDATIGVTYAIAAAAGIPIWHQLAGLSLGIQAAFAVHVGCTLKNATMPCDELPFIHENDLIGGALPAEAGHFRVPAGPGLGVQLDETALRHYRVD
jgi:hypothetical protein